MMDHLYQFTCQMKLGQVFPCFFSGDLCFSFFMRLRKNNSLVSFIISQSHVKWEVFLIYFLLVMAESRLDGGDGQMGREL